jgi:hypothetical protein
VPNAIELIVLRLCEQAPNQRSEFLVRQGCELQQARVQALELALGHRVEVDTTNALVDTRALQPTKKDLGSTRIENSALAQTTFDLRITARFTLSARGTDTNRADGKHRVQGRRAGRGPEDRNTG